MAVTTAPQPQAPARPAAGGMNRLLGPVRSEFTKMRSVRSTYWTVLILVVVSVGLGVLLSWAADVRFAHESASARATFDPTAVSLSGFFLGQLIIAVLGALTVTSEFSSGMIRTTLSTQPHRVPAYLAKVIVLTVVAFVAGLISSCVAFLCGQAVLVGTHHSVSISGPNELRAVIGGGLFLAVCALFAFGIGALLRQTAGAIAVSIGVLFVPPILLQFVSTSWQNDVSKYLPSEAGSRILTTTNLQYQFSAWTGFGVFCGYTAVLVIAGLILFNRRDVN
jgi:ABC-2 type transport system permease protein